MDPEAVYSRLPLKLRDWRPAVALVFNSVGPDEDIGVAEELAETPEAIEKPTVLWHVARCTGAEDFDVVRA